MSTSEVYGSARERPMTEDHPTRPATVYGASKLAGERAVLDALPEGAPGYRLDLAVAFALRHVQDVFDDIPSFMLDETLGVRLDGAAIPALETVGDDEARQLRVAAGTLTLWSTALDDDVIVQAGMCVVGPEDEEEPAEGRHPLFGGVQAQECGR